MVNRSIEQTPPFIGREPEMELLRTGLDDCLAGTCRLFLLFGEPGIGKTRTAEELIRCARERGARVLWGRCVDEEGAPPFWPWVQVVRAAIKDLDADTLRSVMGPGGPDLAAIVPEVRRRLPELPVPAGLDLPQARFRLFDSIAGFLDQLGNLCIG